MQAFLVKRLSHRCSDVGTQEPAFVAHPSLTHSFLHHYVYLHQAIEGERLCIKDFIGWAWSNAHYFPLSLDTPKCKGVWEMWSKWQEEGENLASSFRHMKPLAAMNLCPHACQEI